MGARAAWLWDLGNVACCWFLSLSFPICRPPRVGRGVDVPRGPEAEPCMLRLDSKFTRTALKSAHVIHCFLWFSTLLPGAQEQEAAPEGDDVPRATQRHIRVRM